MGLCIHYKGKIRKKESLPVLINELKDIAESCKWKYHIFEKEFPDSTDNQCSTLDELYGICIIPPGSEPVSICFLADGRMTAPMLHMLYANSTDSKEQIYLCMISVKTQYAGIEVHRFVVELFRYLHSNGYFEYFEMIDEGSYWETKDEKLLQEIFNRYNLMMDNFALALETIPMEKDEKYENYF
jgi:hypothetical protein